MKIVQINATYGKGSTGKICLSLSRLMNDNNIKNYIIHSGENTEYENSYSFGNTSYLKLQSLKARIFGNWGFNSKQATKKIINKLDEISPDIVHLHNIHGHDCDLDTIFSYFKQKNTKLIWTFHDCWTFTGYCTHFTLDKCYKWKTECVDCVQNKKFSWFVDRSKELYNRKRTLFSGLDLTIITPSKWLADLVNESLFKEYSVKVINNGINLDVFKPIESDIKQIYNINDKYIVLGVAFGWSVSKGIDVFVKLAEKLDERYQIILIGTDDNTDKILPKNIISIHRTQDQHELAKLYSAADLFVNPTREDSYPTVNMESLACGTPVVTFRTGGSPESVDDSCGSVVDVDDIDSLYNEVTRICETKPYSQEACLKRAILFDKDTCFREYIKTYEAIFNDRTSKN